MATHRPLFHGLMYRHRPQPTGLLFRAVTVWAFSGKVICSKEVQDILLLCDAFTPVFVLGC